MKVFVLNKNGNPLMPCKPHKAKKLLKQNKAVLVNKTPFTIKLLYGSAGYKQPITLGVDSGFKNVGLSAVSKKKELFCADVSLRTDIPKLLLEKRMFRRGRRGRKIWYRKPRFLNRARGKLNRARGKGWFAPSIQHKLDTHIKIIDKIKKILPVSDVVVEVASFDTQKMMNPEISGVEYQQGELQGYEVRQYLLEKWGRKCAYCGKKDIPLEIEHIIPKSRGGSDRVSNLTIACNECNQKKDKQTAEEFGFPNIQKKANKSLKATAFMNNVRWKLVNQLKSKSTFGSITKYNRIRLGISKSHINDAFVIAGGIEQNRNDIHYLMKQVRRSNRKLRRGKRSEVNNLLPTVMYGFKLFDTVLFNGKKGYVAARRKSGYFKVKTLTGEMISDSASYKKLKLLGHQNSFLIEPQFIQNHISGQSPA